jgi:hypothetical protein
MAAQPEVSSRTAVDDVLGEAPAGEEPCRPCPLLRLQRAAEQPPLLQHRARGGERVEVQLAAGLGQRLAGQSLAQTVRLQLLEDGVRPHPARAQERGGALLGEARVVHVAQALHPGERRLGHAFREALPGQGREQFMSAAGARGQELHARIRGALDSLGARVGAVVLREHGGIPSMW